VLGQGSLSPFYSSCVTGFSKRGLEWAEGSGRDEKVCRGGGRTGGFLPWVEEGPVGFKASRRGDSDVWFRVASLLLLFLLLGFPSLMREESSLRFG